MANTNVTNHFSKVNTSQKSPYPSLNVKSLQFRCAYDIKKFLSEQSGAIHIKNALFEVTDVMTLDQIKTLLVQRILEPISKLLEKQDSYISNSNFNHRNGSYVSDVPHLKLNIQQQVWQYRTYLFYQLLIIETQAFLNSTLYNEIFNDYDTANKLEYPFNDAINGEVLDAFGLGIFGSLTPTSDIDIGFEYLGKPVKNVLTYIVSRFESLFYIFTDKSSLKWDIESYGNLLALANQDKETQDKFPEYFYLDTSKLTYEQYTQLLKYAAASMMRNILMHVYSEYKDPIEREKIIKNSTPNSKSPKISIEKVVTRDFLKYFQTDNVKWIKEGRAMAEEYLNVFNNNPKEADKKYYELLNKAEQRRAEIIMTKTSVNGKNIEFTSDEIFEIINLWAKAGLWRRENYLLSPSVIHVVRTLQASKNSRTKYNTSTPGQICNGQVYGLEAFCTIGKYGYMFSILEQLGYIIRFYNTYCTNIEEHFDINKCNKKYAKYIERIENAAIRIVNNKKDEGEALLTFIKNLKGTASNVVANKPLNKPSSNTFFIPFFKKTTSSNKAPVLPPSTHFIPDLSRLKESTMQRRLVAPVAGGRRTHKKRTHKKRALKKRTRRNKF